MVQIYVKLINEGLRTLEQVPGVIRDDVAKALESGQ
ncbi:CD1375 family protein [Bacillus infantis]